MRFTALLLVFLGLTAGTAACGSSVDESERSQLPSAADESDATGSSVDSGSSDGSNPVCQMLSTSEIEAAVGRVVTGTVDQGVDQACLWEFEPLTEGIFAGTPPELVVQVFAGTEWYENALAGYPDRPRIDGIGDGALSRGDGEVSFVSNGTSGNLGTLFAFDAGQEADANRAVQELAALLADRL